MKRLVLISGAVLFLSVLLSANPTEALAQPPASEVFDYIVVYMNAGPYVYHCMILKNGDVYNRRDNPPGAYPWEPTTLHPTGNFWGNLPPRLDMVCYRITVAGEIVSHYVLLSNGDVYLRTSDSQGGFLTAPFFMGNYWNGPVSTNRATWGGVKEQYKK